MGKWDNRDRDLVPGLMDSDASIGEGFKLVLKVLVGRMTSGSPGVVCRGGLMMGILMMGFYLFGFISRQVVIGYRSE